MPCNLLGVGFLKLYGWRLDENNEKVIDTNSVRFIDVIPNLGIKDEVIQPYFFTYDYPQYENTFKYSMHVEQMNTEDMISRLRSISPQMSKNQILQLSASFLPQNKTGNFVLTDVASSTHTINKNESQGSIYAMILEGEKFLELYTPSKDPNDPYGIWDPENVTSMKDTITLDMEDYVRSLVIGVTQDLTKLDYNDPVLTLASNPIKWLVDDSQHNYARIPSSKSMNGENDLIKPNAEGLLVGDRLIVDNTPQAIHVKPYTVGVNDPIGNITDTF